MGALPRPDAPARNPPGPRRRPPRPAPPGRLAEPAHASPARPAAATPPSRTSSPPLRLPTWGILELLVEAMDGDTAAVPRPLAGRHHPPADDDPAAHAPHRRPKPELAAVRRHLETGTGLLLVTGEAGIGKTRLVSTAAAIADTVRRHRPVPAAVVRGPAAAGRRRAAQAVRRRRRPVAQGRPHRLRALRPRVAAASAARAGRPTAPARRTTLGAPATFRAPSRLSWRLSAYAAVGRAARGPALGRRGHPRPPRAPARPRPGRAGGRHLAPRRPGHARAHGSGSGTYARRGRHRARPAPAEPGGDRRAGRTAGPDRRPIWSTGSTAQPGQPLFTEQLAAPRRRTALPRFLPTSSTGVSPIAATRGSIARALGSADRSLPVALLEVATGLGATGCGRAARAAGHACCAPRRPPAAPAPPPGRGHPPQARPGRGSGGPPGPALALGLSPTPHPPRSPTTGRPRGTVATLTWRIRAARAARERFSVQRAPGSGSGS